MVVLWRNNVAHFTFQRSLNLIIIKEIVPVKNKFYRFKSFRRPALKTCSHNSNILHILFVACPLSSQHSDKGRGLEHILNYAVEGAGKSFLVADFG